MIIQPANEANQQATTRQRQQVIRSDQIKRVNNETGKNKNNSNGNTTTTWCGL